MNMAVDLEENTQSLADYLAILKRRKKQMLPPALVIIAIAVLAALFWPPSYRATATILIEEQEIPQDLVRSTITSYANQQIKVISQRIMTLSNIMDIVTKYDLLSERELKNTPRTEIVAKFQKKMKLELLSAEVVDPRFGQPRQTTIAFTLSFDHRNPKLAQKVANELVNLYMNENLKTRSEKTATTAEFLKNEAESLQAHISQLEGKISEFKQQNEGALPELYQYNLNVIERTNADLLDAKNRLSELEKRKLELQANMTQISQYAPTEMPTGERVLSDYDRLKALRSDYRSKSALYSADHPDVTRLKREIETLEKTLGVGLSAKDYAEQLQTEQHRLSELKQTYTADHPEVLKQQRVVDTLIKERSDAASTKAAPQPDNPAYVLLDTQLKSAEADSRMLVKRISELSDKIAKFESYLSKAPNVEKSYAELMRELQTNTLKYQEIKAKQMEAELAKNLESERKGERFELIEPPILPDDPVSPNRIAILVIGVMLAALAGVGVAVVNEMLDQSVRGTRQLTELLGAAPLASIPYLLIDEEQQSRRQVKLGLVAAVAGGIIALLLIFHFAVRPLDVMWFVAMRKLGLY